MQCGGELTELTNVKKHGRTDITEKSSSQLSRTSIVNDNDRRDTKNSQKYSKNYEHQIIIIRNFCTNVRSCLITPIDHTHFQSDDTLCEIRRVLSAELLNYKRHQNKPRSPSKTFREDYMPCKRSIDVRNVHPLHKYAFVCKKRIRSHAVVHLFLSIKVKYILVCP
jgi:hypothetical protein